LRTPSYVLLMLETYVTYLYILDDVILIRGILKLYNVLECKGRLGVIISRNSKPCPHLTLKAHADPLVKVKCKGAPVSRRQGGIVLFSVTYAQVELYRPLWFYINGIATKKRFKKFGIYIVARQEVFLLFLST